MYSTQKKETKTAQDPRTVSEIRRKSGYINDLAAEFYRILTECENKKNNLVFSPVSIVTTLALAEIGADGRTRDEILRVIDSFKLNRIDVSEFYAVFHKSLQIDDRKEKLKIVNAWFIGDEREIDLEFLRKVRSRFPLTEISKVPFRDDSERMRQRINQWIANESTSQTSETFEWDGSVFNQETSSVLANAVHLKALWRHPFFTKNCDGEFYCFGKYLKPAVFMTQDPTWKYYNYFENFLLQMVELPCGDGAMSVYVVLPRERKDIDLVEKILTGYEFSSWLRQATINYQVFIKIPKFTIRSSVNLKSILRQLDCQSMFAEDADFGHMFTDFGYEPGVEEMKISDAAQEVLVKVNEYGINYTSGHETAIGPKNGVDPRNRKQFIANHPFIFLVTHRATGTIAVMGKVETIEDF